MKVDKRIKIKDLESLIPRLGKDRDIDLAKEFDVSRERIRQIRLNLNISIHSKETREKISRSCRLKSIENLAMKLINKKKYVNKDDTKIFPVPYIPMSNVKNELKRPNCRFYNCTMYDICLAIACKKGWQGFSCMECKVFKNLKVA